MEAKKSVPIIHENAAPFEISMTGQKRKLKRKNNSVSSMGSKKNKDVNLKQNI
jgi:hypothetical protein